MPECRKIIQAFLIFNVVKILPVIYLTILCMAVSAQFRPESQRKFNQHETELVELSNTIVYGLTERERAEACFKFIPKLVEALKTGGSYNYPFDSLKTVSILSPDDNSFRIFTWQLSKDNGTYRFYGAIQMNSPEELKLYPLYDYSDSLYSPVDSVLSNEKWYGALYYKVYETKHKKNKYYTLFGWDGNDFWSTKKILDVLHFEDGLPVFGAPLFDVSTDEEEKIQHRYILEYKKTASVALNYLESEKMIVFDHLSAPEDRLADLKFTYIPDGTYEGFRWKKGKWEFVEKVYHYSIDEFDKPPLPKPLK